MPPTLPSMSSHSPVCRPARTSMPSSLTASAIAEAQRIARADELDVLLPRRCPWVVVGLQVRRGGAEQHGRRRSLRIRSREENRHRSALGYAENGGSL